HGLAGDKAVAELMESLPPDLALEVCASLAGAPARAAKRPCDELREIAALAPAAPPVRPMVGVAEWDIPTPPAGPQLSADAAPAQSAAPPPPPSPVAQPEPATPAPAIQMMAAAPEPPAADLADTLAAAGVWIASAQTTEPGLPTANDGDLEVTLLPDPAELVVPAISEDVMAYWLVMSDVPSPGPTNTGSLVDNATTDDEAVTSAEAAKAMAQAKAKAKAKAQAEAKAKAKAQAQARARAGAKAVAAALNADKDTGNGATAGSGKDRDQGASGAGSGNNDGGGGGKN
ncbi:MAG: hypothetical protein ACREEV_18630, partial [Dongiaceae bacterium]